MIRSRMMVALKAITGGYCKWTKISYQFQMDGELIWDCPIQLICREWVSEVNLCML